MTCRPRSLLAVALASLQMAGPVRATARDSVPAPPPLSLSLPAAAASPAPPPSRTRAWVALGAGLGLTAVSFALAESADDAYARYVGGVDPDALEADYDRAVRCDRWAAATLLAGQLALALGLYWHFVARPGGTPAAPASGPGLSLRCDGGRDGPRLMAALQF